METEPPTLHDPFAEAGAEEVASPFATLAATFERYRNGEIQDDTQLDALVGEVEAQFLDLHFQERFEEMEQLSIALHAMCGELEAAAFGRSEYFSEHDHAGHEGEESDDDEDGNASTRYESPTQRRRQRVAGFWAKLLHAKRPTLH
ncbi:MAG TPA: hypothetical protein VIM53_03035 [Candidatus Saccharimonadales bacterium]